jgi:hypothetical protein
MASFFFGLGEDRYWLPFGFPRNRQQRYTPSTATI